MFHHHMKTVLKTEQGKKQTLPSFQFKFANYGLTPSIPTHDGYCQKLFNNYASHFHTKKELRS
jgi:hypothetical protein